MQVGTRGEANVNMSPNSSELSFILATTIYGTAKSYMLPFIVSVSAEAWMNWILLPNMDKAAGLLKCLVLSNQKDLPPALTPPEINCLSRSGQSNKFSSRLLVEIKLFSDVAQPFR